MRRKDPGDSGLASPDSPHQSRQRPQRLPLRQGFLAMDALWHDDFSENKATERQALETKLVFERTRAHAVTYAKAKTRAARRARAGARARILIAVEYSRPQVPLWSRMPQIGDINIRFTSEVRTQLGTHLLHNRKNSFDSSLRLRYYL